MASTTSTIPFVAVPFADQDQQKVASLDFLKSGVTPEMIIPTQNGGMKFSRSMLNGIGYFATLGAYLDRIGYPYGKERDRGNGFGGYPKGAILFTEDDGYIREYISQEDNNTWPLPTEEADGTYEGDEHWKPTLPPVVDFFPDYTTLVDKVNASVTGEGRYTYTTDEDGWYQLACYYRGLNWAAAAKYNNDVFQAICQVMISNMEVGRLDGRFSVATSFSNESRTYPVSSATLPLKKGTPLTFRYKFSDAQYHEVIIRVKRWGVSTL